MKAYYANVDPDEIQVPDNAEGAPQLGDFYLDEVNYIGYLLVIEGQDVYIFTNEDCYEIYMLVSFHQ